MGDLSIDTAVTGGDGHYHAELCSDWEIWGPNGGYLAAVALRAAGEHSTHDRPVSFLCHFLDVASFSPVRIEVEAVRGGKRAESLRVSITQDGRRILEGLVWVVDDGLDGLVHDAAPPPVVPGVIDLLPIDTLLEKRQVQIPAHAFFSNLEERPIDWIDDWEHRPAADPLQRCWYKFRPVAVFDDNWLDAARLLILIDTFQWPAAVRGHAGGTVHHVAPSLDLACWFHRLDVARHSDWLLVEARSPAAADAIVGGAAAVWDSSGTLLASGGQQMLCRAAPNHA